MFTDYLKKLLAKSDGTTIEKHIKDLERQFDIFVNYYPDVLTDGEKEVLKTAIHYHDYGKLNRLFQCKLPIKNKPVRCRTGEKDDIVPHQYLSPLFLRKLESDFSHKEMLFLIYAIMNHHSRGREKYLNSKGIDILIDEIKNNIKDFFHEIKITQISPETEEFYRKYLELIVEEVADIENLNAKFERETDFVKSLIKTAGLLIRIDHSASGEDLIVEEEPISEDRKSLFFSYLRNKGSQPKLRPFQEKFKDKENLVLVADTGLGKTGLAVLWSKRKMFYILPNRASTNAMFETMNDILGSDKVGLLHSTSLFYIHENANAEDYTVLRDFENTKNLSKPATISTADQLFTAVFKYPTYEKIYATLSYSDIVIDEIQGFEPAQIVPIIRQIKETTKLGARYLIITATLPQIVKEELEKIGFEIKTNEPETIDKTKRHKVEIINRDVFSVVDKIIQLADKEKNILIITNTVSTAQELYQKLKDRAKLLHSRFIWKARKEKEEQIRNDYKTKKGIIWISTQLVEASLDIDFDVLFTEVATADSLIQRMGRVWRHRTTNYSEKEPNVYILTQVDEKKNSQIYEKALREESIKLIEKYLSKDGFLLSEAKRKIVEILYSRETLEKLNSKYLDRWKEVENVLNSNWDYLFKREAQQIFRDTFSVEVIPYKFKEKVEQLLESMKEIKKIPDRREKRLKRINILKQLNDIKVPIPMYWLLDERVKDKAPFEILDKNYNIIILARYFDYDDKIGIKLNKENLEKYGLDEDMFL